LALSLIFSSIRGYPDAVIRAADQSNRAWARWLRGTYGRTASGSTGLVAALCEMKWRAATQ
jgi:hypothetical protein